MDKISKKRVAAWLLAAVTAVSGATSYAMMGSASAAPKVQVLRLISHSTAEHQTGKTTFAGAGTDRRLSDRKIIGYDVVSGRFHPQAGKATIDVAAALKGGIIYIHLTQDASSNSFTGTITGGTGKYKGIVGTVTGHSKGQSPNTFVTLRYHF
jgi:hypothetical protein